MLISYPILPANAANQSDQAKFDAMVALTQPTRGLYPITTGNRWHGGIHLTPGTEPIRAIADGVIVAYRLAPATKDYPGQGLYDTSFVLIKHDTHSGENTQVVYYSLYMHLAPKGSLTDAQRSQMMPFLRNAATGESATQAPANTRVWRKEVLGFGGQLYGVPTVHFEIFTTEADLARFWRDASAVAAGGHGSNDVFGIPTSSSRPISTS
ncbi:M23 family metallopeptidase [Xanthomonas oryzae]|uniref:M23 family metallopeptidase n=1 Tax=Xanthomonas oryzae TaxID=347 RepID=UPI000AC483C5|nr:M23 family metallopeptidase [Xanthomonas oryzae]